MTTGHRLARRKKVTIKDIADSRSLFQIVDRGLTATI
jgi:hypothetical protein